MANLTIRNLPEEVHSALKERAKLNRRSLNQEVIAGLASVASLEGEELGLAASRERMRQAVAKVFEARAGMKRFMTAEEIDQGRIEGRK